MERNNAGKGQTEKDQGQWFSFCSSWISNVYFRPLSVVQQLLWDLAQVHFTELTHTCWLKAYNYFFGDLFWRATLPWILFLFPHQYHGQSRVWDAAIWGYKSQSFYFKRKISVFLLENSTPNLSIRPMLGLNPIPFLFTTFPLPYLPLHSLLEGFSWEDSLSKPQPPQLLF
jgi:hypothetical protein